MTQRPNVRSCLRLPLLFEEGSKGQGATETAKQQNAKCSHWEHLALCKQWLWWLIVMRPQKSREKPLAEIGWHFHFKTRWDQSQVKDLAINDHIPNVTDSQALSFEFSQKRFLAIRTKNSGSSSNGLYQICYHPPVKSPDLSRKANTETWQTHIHVTSRLLNAICASYLFSFLKVSNENKVHVNR